LRWFGLPACTANPEGQTSITGTARFVLATFYIASLPFQDTPPIGGYTRPEVRPVLITERHPILGPISRKSPNRNVY